MFGWIFSPLLLIFNLFYLPSKKVLFLIITKNQNLILVDPYFRGNIGIWVSLFLAYLDQKSKI